MRWTVWREATAGTADTTGWPVREKVRRVVGSQRTDRSKLIDMVVTPDNRDGEVVQQEKRQFLTVGVQRRSTVFAPNSGLAAEKI